MIITVTPRTMRGTGTCHTACRRDEGWDVSWLPGRILTEDQALAAMKIAASATGHRPRMDRRLSEWAGLLGLSPAVARSVASPVRRGDAVMSRSRPVLAGGLPGGAD